MIDVYTIQDRKAWFEEQFNEEEKYFFASWNHEESFIKDGDSIELPYKWLREQLPSKIKNYSGDAPIWAWLKRVNLRAYMRGLWRSNYDKKSPDWIIVHARVPEIRTVQTCYSRWHIPLNLGFFKEGDNDKYPGDITDTWHHVFDITNDNKWLVERYGKAEPQICIDHIYANEVVSTYRIVGRKRRAL